MWHVTLNCVGFSSLFIARKYFIIFELMMAFEYCNLRNKRTVVLTEHNLLLMVFTS